MNNISDNGNNKIEDAIIVFREEISVRIIHMAFCELHRVAGFQERQGYYHEKE